MENDNRPANYNERSDIPMGGEMRRATINNYQNKYTSDTGLNLRIWIICLIRNGLHSRIRLFLSWKCCFPQHLFVRIRRMGRCGLSIEIFSSKISQLMLWECLVDVDLVVFLGVFCKATGEVATHGHFLTGRRAGAPRTCNCTWVPKLLMIVCMYRYQLWYPGTIEVFAVIFDDSVYLHGVVETNEAPELSFDLFRILFCAIIISTMRKYLSKNSHTHPMKIDQRNIAEQSSEDRPLFWRDSPRAHLQEYIPNTAEYYICASTSPRIYFR